MLIYEYHYKIKERDNMLRLDKDTLTSTSNLLDEVHDRYFEFDDIVFDTESGELKLYLGEKRKRFFGRVIVSKVLKIRGVTDCTSADTARISQNSINNIKIDIDRGIIDIECNAPAEFRLHMKPDFEILLESSEK